MKAKQGAGLRRKNGMLITFLEIGQFLGRIPQKLTYFLLAIGFCTNIRTVCFDFTALFAGHYFLSSFPLTVRIFSK